VSAGEILKVLHTEQMAINPEDVARSSPLGYEHINILGRCRFDLSEDLKNGAMSPLQNKLKFERLRYFVKAEIVI
jgi:hypothetical protein